MKFRVFGPLAWLGLLLLAVPVLRAWNYPGHRMVNQVALASLPPDFPGWARAPVNAERIAFLAGEPDRWRNTFRPLLQHANGLDHYVDLEQLSDAGLELARLTPFRYDFAAQFAAARSSHPDRFPPIDPQKNPDHSREWPGFLPWAIAEYCVKLQSTFSTLKTLQGSGTPSEIANAQADAIYVMGVMGHYVGDGSQPLHVTVHHHGWVGPNPKGYSTGHRVHEWIDGGFIAKAGITSEELLPQVKPAEVLDFSPRAGVRDALFARVVEYLSAQQVEVEPLYRLEKSGQLRDGGPGSAKGRQLIDAQLLKGGEMLGGLWLTAWRRAATDPYLQKQLQQRGPLKPRRD